MSMKFNASLSKKIARYIIAKPNQCYSNSALAVIHLDSDGKQALLCEGLAVPNTIRLPMEHAWVEYNGDIIDVTWLDGAAVYYPFYKHDADKTLKHAESGKTFPIEKRLYGGLSSTELLDLYKELMDASKDVK